MFELIDNPRLVPNERRFIEHYTRCYRLLADRDLSYDEWCLRCRRLVARIEREAARLEWKFV